MDKQDRMVTRLFGDRTSAEQAYRALTERGYTGEDVDVILSDATRNKYFADLPEERVRHCEAGIKEGGIFMGVRPRSEEDARVLYDD